MIDLQTIGVLVAVVSVIAGFVFTLLELRNLSRSRRTEIIMKIYEQFGSREIVEAIFRVGASKFENLQDYSKRYGLTDITQIAVLFEGVGVLLEQNLIDMDLVNRLFGPSVESFWKPNRPIIEGMREAIKEPFLFSNVEYLYNRLNEYRRAHSLSPASLRTNPSEL